MAEKYPINIWVNEDRYDKLNKAGLADMCKEMLAGLKVIQVFTNDAQKDKVLKLYPMAKFDSATTKSIELLPREVKDNIFNLVVKKKSIDVMEEFIKSHAK